MADGQPPTKRARLSDDEFHSMSREDLFVRWKQQEGYLRTLESKLADLNSSDVTGLRESEERLKHQQQESLRRENILVMRLATKEQEMQECATQIASLKQGQMSSASHLRSCLVDPAVNLLFTKMKSELQQSKDKLQQAHDELSAWKFTPDSQTGKKLMSKCRMLIQENQELGRQLSQGRVAQLEAELALQKKYSQELKSGQDELNDFIIQLDEEVEGMQSTILVLQQQLKEARQKLQQLSAATPGAGGPNHGPAASQSPQTTASAAGGSSPAPPPPQQQQQPANAAAARAPSESRSSPGRSPAQLSEASARGVSDAERDFSPPPSPDDGSGYAGGSSDRAGEPRSCSPAEGTSSCEPGSRGGGGGAAGGTGRIETERAESPEEGEGGGADGRAASAEQLSASPDTASGPQQSPEQSNGVCVASSSTAARSRPAGGGGAEPAASSPLDKEDDEDEDMETGGAGGGARGNHLAEERGGGGVSSSGGVVKGYEDIDSPVGSDSSPRSGPASPKPAAGGGGGGGGHGVEADTAGGATLNGFEHPSDSDEEEEEEDEDDEEDDDERSS